MLTADFGRLALGAGHLVLDLGCGAGRHAFESARRGAAVVAVDRDAAGIKDTAAMLWAMRAAGESPADAMGTAVNADALALPFHDGTFDRVIAAEVLEHVPADGAAVAELVRVLRPGGRLAVTVPRWFPERVCWALSDDYHAPAVPDGHVRVYRRSQLFRLLAAAGLKVGRSHHAHALHTPYWWLKCAVGVRRDDSWPVKRYHRFLVWELTTGHRATRSLERALRPLIGKSLVVYADKPE
ncbi:MAG: methyltransferase domain-containing protein [Acidimicrobiales bacterium]